MLPGRALPTAAHAAAGIVIGSNTPASAVSNGISSDAWRSTPMTNAYYWNPGARARHALERAKISRGTHGFT
jgi:hypothetical protein